MIAGAPGEDSIIHRTIFGDQWIFAGEAANAGLLKSGGPLIVSVYRETDSSNVDETRQLNNLRAKEAADYAEKSVDNISRDSFAYGLEHHIDKQDSMSQVVQIAIGADLAISDDRDQRHEPENGAADGLSQQNTLGDSDFIVLDIISYRTDKYYPYQYPAEGLGTFYDVYEALNIVQTGNLQPVEPLTSFSDGGSRAITINLPNNDAISFDDFGSPISEGLFNQNMSNSIQDSKDEVLASSSSEEALVYRVDIEAAFLEPIENGQYGAIYASISDLNDASADFRHDTFGRDWADYQIYSALHDNTITVNFPF